MSASISIFSKSTLSVSFVTLPLFGAASDLLALPKQAELSHIADELLQFPELVTFFVVPPPLPFLIACLTSCLRKNPVKLRS